MCANGTLSATSTSNARFLVLATNKFALLHWTNRLLSNNSAGKARGIKRVATRTHVLVPEAFQEPSIYF